MATHNNRKNMLFEMHQYDIKKCHYNMAVFAVHGEDLS